MVRRLHDRVHLPVPGSTPGRMALTLGVALFAAACGRESISGPRAPSSIAGISNVAAGTRTIAVCKAASSPAGTYTFNNVYSGSSNTGDVNIGPSFTLTVTSGQTAASCATVYTRTQHTSDVDAPASVQVTEAAAPGTTLSNITTTGSGAAPAVIDVPNRRVTLSLNAFHDATATFFNTAVPTSAGCTYTQGYYKNKGKGLLPSGNFFSSGKTYLQVLKTAPRGGNAYYILAHQYIAATLNIKYGASSTTDVNTAIATATAYFNGTNSSLTRDQLIALAGTLDSYNNGVTGPGHCGRGDSGDDGGDDD